MKLLYSPVLAYIMLGVMIFAELTPLRRSALAFACLKRGSSFVMVYWCIICSVFALYASWKSESDMWCENAPVSKRARSQLYGEDLTSLCSSWLFLACLMERSSATCVNLMLSAFWRYLVCEKTGKQACLIQRKVHSINWNVCAQAQHRTDITEQLSSFLGLGNVHTPFSLPADSFHPVQVWTILVLRIKNQVIFLCRHLSTKRLGLIPSSRLSHLTLQGISLFGLLDLDVIRHDGVVVQLCAIFQVTCQGLSLFGMAQVDHVVRKAVLGLALLGALLVFNLKWWR